MAASEMRETLPCLQENGPRALLSTVRQKQLRCREGDSEDQIQGPSLHRSHGYHKGNRSQCPSLGVPWLGVESFPFTTGLEALQWLMRRGQFVN